MELGTCSGAKLGGHLAVCPACSAALRDYQEVIRIGMPSVAPEHVPNSISTAPAASVESTKRRLFETISLEAKCRSVFPPALNSGAPFVENKPQIVERNLIANPQWDLRTLLRCAAAFFLVAGLVVAAYRLGEQRVARLPSSNERQSVSASNNLQSEVTALTKERRALDSELRERDQAGMRLAGELTQQQKKVTELRDQEQSARDALLKSDQENSQLASEHDAIDQQLKEAQATLAITRANIDSLRRQRDADMTRAAGLETRIAELSESLKDRDDTIAQQQPLLASDRDIRDLMGARDLYIVEVYDVARNGQMKKPFGRVFLTKDKSLIFYAYDLQQQPGATQTSTFQAWGQRGPDRKGAVSLGIFYMDNAANKRWVVKVDDPKTLKQIDAVFVTVEPNGGSPKPSGKQLLFAYLRVDPNHP